MSSALTATVPIAEDTWADIRLLPKVLLHDHLDGGLRTDTIIELAEAVGYRELPANDPDELADWFHKSGKGSLPRYLEAFRHTVAVMQTPQAIERVAYEAAVDLAADGVVYAEIRMGIALLTERGLTLEEVIESIIKGFERGELETGIVARTIVTALRHHSDSEAVASSAVKFAGRGVVGFDLAGPEADHPPEVHAAACEIARTGGLGLTIHAGEAAGLQSMWQARLACHAQRFGHGVRIIEGTRTGRGEIIELGSFARSIRDQRVPLELAMSSNVDTGTIASLESHPVEALLRAGFAVTLNTDNRLMSRTSMSNEFAIAHVVHGFRAAELLAVTENALHAAFGDWPTRERLLRELVRPHFAEFTPED
ncbi:MAG: adenosine deaminase [Acidimicrobiia bacterium]|nr:adenosine deaminase [Acidimicrobiia bacterium]